MNENEIRLEILKLSVSTLHTTYQARLKGIESMSDDRMKERMRMAYPGISDIVSYSEMMAGFVFDEDPIEESTEGL